MESLMLTFQIQHFYSHNETLTVKYMGELRWKAVSSGLKVMYELYLAAELRLQRNRLLKAKQGASANLRRVTLPTVITFLPISLQ